MRHSASVSPKVKISALTPQLNFLPATKHWAKTCAFALILLIFLYVPKTGWAEENYFQIINGTVEAVDDTFVRDRGYAVFFNFEGKKFLLDTGDNESSFIGNLKTAGINTDELDYVLLSHRHKDHTSGWIYLRKQRPQLDIYIPSGAVFSLPTIKFNEVSGYLKMTPNVYLIHTHDESGSIRIKDELSLLIRTKEGPYLFTTNSHTDFFMKLEKAREIMGESVFFHSGHTARKVTYNSKILETAKKMKDLHVKKVSPSHSKYSHDKIFERVFGTGYVPAILGKKVPLEPADSM